MKVSASSIFAFLQQSRLAAVVTSVAGFAGQTDQQLAPRMFPPTRNASGRCCTAGISIEARAVFSEVLGASLLHFKGAGHPRLIARTMQSRWGSLSHAGAMTSNVNLVRAPRPCIVVTHELCHIEHRNHDARFFKLLGQVMPDWEQRKRRLESALL